MKSLHKILLITALGTLSTITFDYALAIDCHDRFIFAWHTLNPVLECLDVEITTQTLDDLDDVVISSPATNQTLQYNGTFWINDVPINATITCSTVDGFICWGSNSFVNDIGSGRITITTTNTQPLILNVTADGINSINMISGSNTAGSTPQLRFSRSGNNSVFPTAVTNNMVLGTGQIRAYDGSGYSLSGAFRFSASENWSVTNHGTDMEITCTPIGSGATLNVICLTVNDTTLIIGNPNRLALNNRGLTAVRTFEYPNESGRVITNTTIHSQIVGDVYQSVTKTNIPIAYADIYTSTFDWEIMTKIDCADVEFLRITFIWDYVGLGSQQLRWVDTANNANVLFETGTFTTDRLGVDTGYFAKPSWCTGIVDIEWQGKSTDATDDPVAYGYTIYSK